LQTIVARTEIQDGGVIGIDRKALAQPAAVFVAAHAKTGREHAPGGPPVLRPDDGRLVAAIHPDGGVYDVGVDGVGCNALDPEVTRVGEMILQRHPTTRCGVPAIDAADVGAQVGQILFCAAEQEPWRKAAAAYSHVPPLIRGLLQRFSVRAGYRQGEQAAREEYVASHAPWIIIVVPLTI
jgi:hypothetical protein